MIQLRMCYMCSESEDKSVDELTGNHIINIKSYLKNIEIFLVCSSCSQGVILQIRSKIQGNNNLLVVVPL